jgi:hypothetical protein
MTVKTSLTKAFWKSPYFVRLAGLYARYMLVTRKLASRRIADAGLPLITAERLQRVKRSDTLFVLGSGSSINNIPASRWAAIRQHDSIGLNYWLYHDLVPTILYFEVMPDHEDSLIGSFTGMANALAPRYRDTLKIASEFHNGVRLPAGLSPEFRETLFAHVSVPMFVDTDTQLSTSLRLLKGLGVFRPGRPPRTLFKHAGSVTAAISLAVNMGYRRIVLCGIDLTSPQYFFQDKALYPEAGAFFGAIQEGKHETLLPGLYRLTYPADKVIPAIKKHVLDPMGIALFVEDASSALHPKIPVAPKDFWAESLKIAE